MEKHWRQGDLLFVKVKELPSGTYKKRMNGLIQEGETTGHMHRVADLETAEVIEIESGVFLQVGERGVSIVHEEHKTLSLHAGLYEVRRQREYSPEEIRNVQD